MRVLLVQRTISPPGGGNAVAAWMLQALADRHELTTLTERRWDAAEVDRFYGTSLASTAIRQLLPDLVWRGTRGLPGRLDRFRMAVLLRKAQQEAPRFDLLLTADNYAAFGRPGMQYLHFPAILRPEPLRWTRLMYAYYDLCDRVSGLSWETARFNLTLANSAWTAARLGEMHGVSARVLYPPVPDPGAGRPWDERANTFLCIGRFSVWKRFEVAAAILAAVRRVVPDVRLHIVGSAVEADYAERVRALPREHGDWITIDEDLTQQQLHDLMRRSRYGIHAMEAEHFGIAIAEMARAGCIVFVHDSGGQIEAVGQRAEVLWRTTDDAVAGIRRVLEDAALQAELSDALARHAERFSTERFVEDFRAIVAENTSSAP